MSKEALHINSHQYRKIQLVHHTDLEAGFCALLLYALNGIRKAEEHNYLPVIYFDKKNTFHFYEEAYGENVWEYYFEPVSGVSYKQLTTWKEQEVIQAEDIYQQTGKEISHAHQHEKERIATFWSWEEPKDRTMWMAEKRKLGRAYIRKYIRVKSHIQDKVDQFYQEHFSADRVFGVHIRGTDFNYADPTNIDKYVEELNGMIDGLNEQSYQLFLATDQEQFVQVFNEKYPGKVITYDAIRSQNEIAPFRLKNVSSYKKGEDVLIDVLLLSKCDHLLKGAATVGEVALWFNENQTCTDFGLESNFEKRPRYRLKSAYLKFNVGKQSRVALAMRKIKQSLRYLFQDTFPFRNIRRMFLYQKNK